MYCKVKFAVCSEIHTKTQIPRDCNVELFMLKLRGTYS
jgi:hypothetical protein